VSNIVKQRWKIIKCIYISCLYFSFQSVNIFKSNFLYSTRKWGLYGLALLIKFSVMWEVRFSRLRTQNGCHLGSSAVYSVLEVGIVWWLKYYSISRHHCSFYYDYMFRSLLDHLQVMFIYQNYKKLHLQCICNMPVNVKANWLKLHENFCNVIFIHSSKGLSTLQWFSFTQN
jgi:hypothetical protein